MQVQVVFMVEYIKIHIHLSLSWRAVLKIVRVGGGGVWPPPGISSLGP